MRTLSREEANLCYFYLGKKTLSLLRTSSLILFQCFLCEIHSVDHFGGQGTVAFCVISIFENSEAGETQAPSPSPVRLQMHRPPTICALPDL